LGHVLFSPEGRQKSLGDDALARLGRTREVMMTLPVFSGVCRAVAESDLIALVPRQLAALFAPELHLTLHPVPIPMPVPVIVAVWHKRASANPMHRYMRRIVGEVLRPLNAGKASLPS
jgi:DNA-binding transcriptional LysR family regulator